MGTCVPLSHFTQQGTRHVEDTATRLDAAKQGGRKMGVEVKQFHSCAVCQTEAMLITERPEG